MFRLVVLQAQSFLSCICIDQSQNLVTAPQVALHGNEACKSTIFLVSLSRILEHKSPGFYKFSDHFFLSLVNSVVKLRSLILFVIGVFYHGKNINEKSSNFKHLIILLKFSSLVSLVCLTDSLSSSRWYDPFITRCFLA